jgi:hypothetical protein
MYTVEPVWRTARQPIMRPYTQALNVHPGDEHVVGRGGHLAVRTPLPRERRPAPATCTQWMWCATTPDRDVTQHA